MPDFRSSPSVSRNPMRTLISIMIVSLMAISSAFARKAWHHHSNRAASSNLAPAKALGPLPKRHPDDVALDRKIGSICRRC